VIRIVSAEVENGCAVILTFTDGSKRLVDLRPYLAGPIFELIKADPSFFRSLAVDPDLGTIVWPNGADIDPDVLYFGRTPAAWEAATTNS